MTLLPIAARAAVAYFYLLVLMRASGKRGVAQATSFDFVVALIVGDLVDDALWAEVPVEQFAAAAGSIFLVDVAAKIAAARSTRLFDVFNGRPVVLLRSGAADGRALRAEQLQEADLAHLLRSEGIEEWKQVRLAVLETNDRLSVLREPPDEAATGAEVEAARERVKRDSQRRVSGRSPAGNRS